MKVVFTCNKLNNGGAERVLCNIANALVEDNNDVKIVCLSKTESFYYHIDERINVVEIDKKVNSRKSWLFRKIAGAKNWFLLAKAIKDNDIVISFYTKQNCYSIIAANLLGIPIICAERDHFFLSDGKINHLLRKIFYPRATGFIHQTQTMQNELRKYYHNHCLETIIPNPIWLKCYPERKPIEGYIACVGRLEEQKNYFGIIDAFKIAHNELSYITLHIFGAGPDKKKLEDYIQRLSLSDSVFLEGVSHSIESVYSKANIFVMFSHGEGYPNALLEALSCGVPSISSNCPIGGPADMIVNNENGFLIKNEDTIELAEKMVLLLKDHKLQDDFSIKAIKIRETNDFKSIYKQWCDFIIEVINSAKK